MPASPKYACPNCPRELQFKPEHVGLRVACKFCGFQFRLPRHVLIPCPDCGREGKIRSENLGRKIRCKHCTTIFRAAMKPTPANRPGRNHAPPPDPQLAILKAEVARRDAELAELARHLEEARRDLSERDARPASPPGDADGSKDTGEWDWGDTEAASAVPSGRGTEPDLPLHDRDTLAPSTQMAHVPEADLPRTQHSGPSTDELALRAERDRLRAELDDLRGREAGRIETLERDLSEARAAGLRLASERDEAARRAERMGADLRDREAALAAMIPERDSAREAILRLEAEAQAMRARGDGSAEREALRDERDRARREAADLGMRLAAVGADLAALRDAGPRDAALLAGLRDEVSRLDRERAGLVARADALASEAASLEDQLADAEARERSSRERLGAAEAERDVVRARLATLEAAHASFESETADLARRLRAAEGERDEARARVASLTSGLDRASTERDSARAKAESLARDLAELRASTPAPSTDAGELGQIIRERDQARRELARVRAILDRHGATDPLTS